MPWYKYLAVFNPDRSLAIDESVASFIVSLVTGKNRPRGSKLLEIWKGVLKHHKLATEEVISCSNLQTILTALEIGIKIPENWLDEDGQVIDTAANDYIMIGLIHGLLSEEIGEESMASFKVSSADKTIGKNKLPRHIC